MNEPDVSIVSATIETAVSVVSAQNTGPAVSVVSAEVAGASGVAVVSATVEAPGLSVTSAELPGPGVSVISAAVGGPPGEGSDTITITALNSDEATIYAGMGVAMSATGAGVVRASRDDVTRKAVGVALNTATVGASVTVVVLGLCEVSDWTYATGASWLPPNRRLWTGLDGAATTDPGAGPEEFSQVLAVITGPQTVLVLPSRIIILT